MLNELYKLSNALSASNIKPYSWHREYKELPSSDCYRVWLNDDGVVARIELMDKKLIALCRKYGDNQATFPAFNIAALFIPKDRDSDVERDADTEYIDSIFSGERLIDIDDLKVRCKDNWDEKLLAKVTRCLHKELPGIPGDSAIAVLSRIVQSMDGTTFRVALETYIMDHLETEPTTYLPLLVGKKKLARKDWQGSIILDLWNWEQYENPITNENAVRQINDWLRQADGKTSQSEIQQHRTTSTYAARDAFGMLYHYTGKPEPMPEVRLGSGLVVKLRSMFSEQHCQFRYDNADDESYPIDSANRDAAAAALKWISKPEYEHATWHKIDSSTVLFAYPDKLPETPLKLAALFGGDGSERSVEVRSKARFEDIAKKLISTLDGIPPDKKPSNIQVFALQQIPPATSKRAQVVFTRNIFVDDLIDAANEWQNGCANLPELSCESPVTLFPLQVSKIANNIWRQDGELVNQGKAEVKQMRYCQGMDLLLGMTAADLAYHLHAVVEHSVGLALYVGNTLPHGNCSPISRKAISGLYPLLGLLLYKCGCVREDYMESTACLFGQILKVSDSLHELYCMVKRDGDVPPQLAGNSVYISLAEAPVRAFGLLGTRMAPYIAWAKHYKTLGIIYDEDNPETLRNKGKESWRAKWFLDLYETIVSKLKKETMPSGRFNDMERAQLFIGYLADFSNLKKDVAGIKTPELEEDNNEQ